MTYLVHPSGRLFWNDLPSSLTLDVAAAHGADLALLDWKPSEYQVGSDAIRLALRHGLPCSTGIAMHDHLVSDLLRPTEIARTARAAQASAEKARATMPDELMEYVWPGWKRQGEELDARVAESVATSIREAEDELRDLLEAPIKPELEAHWQQLGGLVPGRA